MSLILVGLAPALAHPATPSTLVLDVGRREVSAELRIPRDQLEMALSGRPTWNPSAPPPEDATVVAYVRRHLSLWSSDHPLDLQVRGPDWVETGGEPFAHLSLRATDAEPLRELVIRDAVVAETVRSHRTHVVLRGDVGAGIDAPDRVVGILNAVRTELTVPAGGAPSAAVALASLRDGFTHVTQGLDHLVFLWELLVAMPLVASGSRWRTPSRVPISRVLAVLSAFTLAHSATLVLASFGIVPIAASVVETLVALSVLLAAVHLARPLWPNLELAFAGTAGLVHGAAFAEGLIGSGLSAKELVLPLASFNLGIEVAQVTFAVATFPLWWTCARIPSLRLVAASVGALAALGWLTEASLDVPHPAQSLFDAVAGVPILAGVVLALAWIAAGLRPRLAPPPSLEVES